MASGHSAQLVQIGVRTGSRVDQVIFCLSDGTQLVWGKTGGNIPQIWKIAPGDFVVRIRVRQGTHLDNIQFVTAQGQTSKAFGGNGGQAREFTAEDGCEIVGLLMDRFRCENYPVASGKVGGVVNRKRDAPIPPIYLRLPGMGGLSRLDANNGLVNGYKYEGQENVVVPATISREELQDIAMKSTDPEARATLLKVLDIPGSKFLLKLPVGFLLQKVLMNDVAALTGAAIPLGLIEQIKAAPTVLQGIKQYLPEFLNHNSAILGGMAGVVLAHILAPIYAAHGDGQSAATSAATAMMGLGVGAVAGGGAAIAVALAVPLAIYGVFKTFGETASEMQQRWKRDQCEIYESKGKPLDAMIYGPSNMWPSCPNRHPLLDDGSPSVYFVTTGQIAGGGRCCANFPGCSNSDKRWQFQISRFYCAYCALEYCENCTLISLRTSQAFPANVLWN